MKLLSCIQQKETKNIVLQCLARLLLLLNASRVTHILHSVILRGTGGVGRRVNLPCEKAGGYSSSCLGVQIKRPGLNWGAQDETRLVLAVKVSFTEHSEKTVKKALMSGFKIIALFTVNFAHLHHNKIQHACEAIQGKFVVLTPNCLASTMDYIVMQIRKINHEKGYYSEIKVTIVFR